MAILTDDQWKLMPNTCTNMSLEKESSKRKATCKSKKAGGGGKGMWNQLDQTYDLDVNLDDPNYDSEDDYAVWLVDAPVADSVEEFKGRVLLIINEYFLSGNIDETADELRDLGCPDFHHYFVKKLVAKALGKHDRDKEKTALLLSALHVDVISSQQLAKGFEKLLQSLDDLVLDIPTAVETSAVFLARAVVDDILPPAFLSNAQKILAEGTKGMEAVQMAMKTYLGASQHAEVERKWGGSSRATVELLTKQIDNLLKEYLEVGDKAEACRCIRQLETPFYHHEVVKRSIILALERKKQSSVLELLKQCDEEGLISSSQMFKGFKRVIKSLHDLSLDIPQARELLEPLVSGAVNEGFLSSSIFAVLTKPSTSDGVDTATSSFKKKATAIIHEYFSSDDTHDVLASLQDVNLPDKYALFVKRLILVAMDRKSGEKEMASALLSAVHAEADTDQVVKGFVLLLQSAEDTALDIPDAGNQLAFFLARAVYDNVLLPINMEEIKSQLPKNSLGREIVGNAKSILSARHAGERILRCWGGGTGWAIEDAKDKIFKIVEEYEAGGDLSEACRCIRELNLPFFHHEIVKQVLDMAMEKQNDKLLSLLEQCAAEGLITTDQMCIGFQRVHSLLEDLALDIPNAENKFWSYVEAGVQAKWLEPEFLNQ